MTDTDLIASLREQITLRNKRIEQLERQSKMLATRVDTLEKINEGLRRHILNLEAEKAA